MVNADSGARRVVGERIVRLPEDGNAFHVSVFTHDDWQARAQDRQLLAKFDSVPELQSLKTQTFFHHYQPSNRLFNRYRSSLTELPCVVVQQGDGTVVYKASGAKIPDDSWRLVDDIREALHERFPNVCPGPNCPDAQPYNDPTLRPVAPKAPVPDVGPKQSAKDDVVGVAVVAGLLCLIGGVALAWRRSG